MIKLVVCDFDGTLVGADFNLPEYAYHYGQKLYEKGILFTLATGRSEYLIEKFVNYLAIPIPYITLNGAAIKQGKKTILKKQFEFQSVKEIVEDADRFDLSVSITVDGIDYVMKKTNWFREEEKCIGHQYQLFSEIKDNKRGAFVEKVCIIEPSQSGLINNIETSIKKNADCTFVRYGNLGVEIMARGVNKAAGVKELAKITGIARDEILAIGDSENDIEMLEYAGIGAVVGNAKNSAKQRADYVAEKNHFDGAAEIIDRFC